MAIQHSSLVNLDTKTIYLIGGVDANEIGYICFNLLHMIEEDDYNEANIKDYKREPIKIYISSYGGELSSAWGLIDIMLSSKTPIYTYCIGFAHSAALKIFLAGEKRYVYEHSCFLYHQLSGGSAGKFSDMKEYVEVCNTEQEIIEDFVVDRTNITREMLGKIKKEKKDWYIYSAEALELNIANDYIDIVE